MLPQVDALAAAVVAFIAFSGLRLIVALVMLYNFGDTRSMALMAVQVEVWEDFIAENIFKGYEWVKRAKDRSGKVLAGKVVHIPQAGVKPRATKNRENFPVPVVRRNDSAITYEIDEISTDSTHIPDADKVELSYDKMASVYDDHFGTLSEESAREILWRWYPSLASQIVRTTGADTAVYLSGQTGTRNAFSDADLANAKKKMVEQTKRETGNWAWIMTEGAYLQIKAIAAYGNKDTMDQYGAVWKDGELVRLRGADIIRTDVTSRYDNTSTPVLKDTTDDNAATDNDVVLLVDFTKVHFALGEIKFFESLNDAHYQGDIYNALVRAGGRRERKDEVGVVAVIQEP